jgi:hypothetical protein
VFKFRTVASTGIEQRKILIFVLTHKIEKIIGSQSVSQSSQFPIRLREPDSTTLLYLQIGPEVEKIR